MLWSFFVPVSGRIMPLKFRNTDITLVWTADLKSYMEMNITSKSSVSWSLNGLHWNESIASWKQCITHWERYTYWMKQQQCSSAGEISSGCCDTLLSQLYLSSVYSHVLFLGWNSSPTEINILNKLHFHIKLKFLLTKLPSVSVWLSWVWTTCQWIN